MDVFAVHAVNNPDKPALVQGQRSVSWSELVDHRNRLATSLVRLGLKAGERVVVYALNAIDWLIVSSAVSAAGAITVPMNHRLTSEEVAYVLDNSGAVMVFVGDRFLPVVEALRPSATQVRHWVLMGEERRDWRHVHHIDDLIDTGSPALDLQLVEEGGSMIYTAGTTGRPKGAVRGRLDPRVALAWVQALGFADSHHVHLVAGPLYHSAPYALSYVTLLMGGTCVVLPAFDPEAVLAAIDAHRCTTTFMAPIMLKRLLALPEEVKAGYDYSSMRIIVVAAAPCPTPVKEGIVAMFGPVLYEFYGSTELGITTVLYPKDVLRKPGSCGQPAPGIELAVLDDEGNPAPAGKPGELYVRRYPGMFERYHGEPETTAAATRGEWMSVGDVGYLDDEGFVYLCDRKRDLVISGGVNVYPAEIEDVLHRMPEIADVAVFGVPDDEWGERVHAAVQLRRGASATEDDVVAFARAHLASYKVPKQVSFHASLPRDSAGKLIKRMLRDPFWAERDTRV